jgi:RimJ/RimL family protein N-acetyltransferase
MIDITNADRSMIHHVLINLRSDDLVEMTACGIDLDRLPEVIMRTRVFAFCAYDLEQGPVAIWGMGHRRPGVGAGFAFGTDRWGHALLPMIKQIRGFVLPFLAQTGFHRVEALAMATRDDVARFMELIGAQPEGVLRRYGVDGEDFISYAWIVDDYRNERAAHQQENRPDTSH